MTGTPLSASDLFAMATSSNNTGPYECHWCASRCGQLWVHDDAPLLPFTKVNPYARRPANGFICAGCWLWQRRRVTVTYLDGGQQDGQTASHHSWWITPEGAWGLRTLAYPDLLARLLKPPRRFVLALLGGDDPPPNMLQLLKANDIPGEVRADTRLSFTFNNIPHAYTVYELGEALKHGSRGKEAGVRLLVELLGPVRPPGEPEPEDTETTIKRPAAGRVPKPGAATVLHKPVKSGS